MIMIIWLLRALTTKYLGLNVLFLIGSNRRYCSIKYTQHNVFVFFFFFSFFCSRVRVLFYWIWCRLDFYRVYNIYYNFHGACFIIKVELSSNIFVFLLLPLNIPSFNFTQSQQQTYCASSTSMKIQFVFFFSLHFHFFYRPYFIHLILHAQFRIFIHETVALGFRFMSW